MDLYYSLLQNGKFVAFQEVSGLQLPSAPATMAGVMGVVNQYHLQRLGQTIICFLVNQEWRLIVTGPSSLLSPKTQYNSLTSTPHWFTLTKVGVGGEYSLSKTNKRPRKQISKVIKHLLYEDSILSNIRS